MNMLMPGQDYFDGATDTPGEAKILRAQYEARSSSGG